MLPKNKTNLFVTNTEQTYFGKKQDKVILEKTGQWTKTEKTYLDKNMTNLFWTKTGQTYF
jgi:hypothetical protein